MFKQPKNLLRRIVVSSIIIMAVCFAAYIYLHGYVNVSGYINKSEITYVPFRDSLNSNAGTANSKDILLTSGLHGIASKTSDGGQFISTVNIPHLFQSEQTPKSPAPVLVETLTRNSFASAFMNGKGLASFDTDGTVRPANKRNITNDNLNDKNDVNFPQFEDFKQINKSAICGLLSVNKGAQPLCYNTATKKVNYYPILDAELEEVVVGQDYGLFTTFNKKLNTLTIYDEKGVVDAKAISLSKDSDMSENEGVPLYSASNQRIAVVTGRDFISSDDDRSDSDADANQTVTILNQDNKKQVSSRTFSDAQITHISLSTTGKYLTVTTLNQTAIYRVDDFASPVFIIPYPSNDFSWVSDDDFIFTTLSNGIFTGSVGSRSASTIIPYGTVRPTKFSFIDGDDVYFTGYAEAIQGISKANIFRASMSTKATTDSVTALKKFPHQGDGYYVDILDGTVTIQLTRYVEDGKNPSVDTTARDEALNFVNETLKDSSKYSIGYSYIDFVIDTYDGEPRGE